MKTDFRVKGFISQADRQVMQASYIAVMLRVRDSVHTTSFAILAASATFAFVECFFA